MTYQKKILIAAILWASISASAGYYVYINIKELIVLNTKTSNINKITQDFQRLWTVILEMDNGIRGYLLSGEDSYLQPFSDAEGLFDGEAKQLYEYLPDVRKEKDNLKEIIDLKASWITGPVMEVMMSRRKLNRQMISNEDFLTTFKNSKNKYYMDELNIRIKNTITPLMAEATQLNEALVERAKQTLITTGLGISLSILVGFLTLLMISRKASRKVDQIISILSGISDNIFSTGKNIERNSDSLTGSTVKVSAAVNETSSTVEQIYQTTLQTAKEAENSKALLVECVQAAHKGKLSIEETIEAMKEIEEQNLNLQKMIRSSNEDMNKIVDLVKSISDKTQIINDIVFQTKLLSFNAAVEAARAGEHGKGFSVVANEIGELASTSGAASKEIFEIVNQAVKDIETIVINLETKSQKEMTEFSEKIDNSIEKSSASNSSLTSIKDKIESFDKYMTNLLAATQEQSKGLSHIREAVIQVDLCSKENDECSKQSLEISNTLKGHVNTLSDTVSELEKLFVNKNLNSALEAK